MAIPSTRASIRSGTFDTAPEGDSMAIIDSTTAPARSADNSPVPVNTVVAWEQHGDEDRYWTHERWGIPGPISPLSFAFADLIYGGMNAGAAAYTLPTRVVARRINTFLYMSEDANAPATETVDHGPRTEQLLDAALTTLGERWDTDWLPEIQQHLAYWENYDLGAASMPALCDHLDDTVVRLSRLWEIHFLIIFPMLLAISEFDELHRDLMGGEDTVDSFRLLQGFDNRTVDGGRALWELSRRALDASPVQRALRDSEPANVLAALETHPDGVSFLAAFRSYLAEYGQRSNNPIELGEPSWIEDPTPVIATLSEYIDQPDRDLAAERTALATEREDAIAAARVRLVGYPRPVVERWETLLRAAQEATILSEDHAFWIDLCGLYQARRIVVEIGLRLTAAGAITVADDVFYLTLDEVRAAMSGRLDRNALALLAARKAEMAYFRGIDPPSVIGSAPPDSAVNDPLGRAMAKFAGVAAPTTTEPGVVRGIAGSSGIVRGTAKVVLSLTDADKLQPGDILVTEYTGPWWTPLFGVAGALVTDFGGVLSHCAVVAREYGIPAVVGTGSATTTLVDGQLVEVDGNQGIVRIIENPSI